MVNKHYQGQSQTGRKRFWTCGLLFFCLLAAAAGCALSEQRVHPEFEAGTKRIEQPVLLPPDIRMLELMPGGLVRQREDWSAVGCRNLQKAILHFLKHQELAPKPLPVNSDTAQEVREVQSLYRLVLKSMHRHTFHSPKSSPAGRRFKYSLGSIDGLLSKLGGDALIFISGYDRVSNSGRKALIELAIADSSGTILYFSAKGTIQGTDLRDPAGADAMAQELLSGFARISG